MRTLPAFQAHKHGTTSVAFSPGGTQLASGGYDGSLRLWDVETGKLKQVLRGHRRGHVVFSPDGLTLVSGGLHRDAVVYDTGSWQERQTLENTSAVWGIAFTPNGKRLAVIQPDLPVQMWDTQTWQVAEELDTGAKYVYALAFAPNENWLAFSDQGRVHIADYSLTKELASFSAHEPLTYGMAFAPSGEWLATVGADKIMRFWNAFDWHLQGEIGHSAPLLCVDISPDGRLAAAGNLDGTIIICSIG